jgi:hypothetical protein
MADQHLLHGALARCGFCQTLKSLRSISGGFSVVERSQDMTVEQSH